MEVSEIKKVIDKKPRAIIKSITGLSDALISDTLTGKVETKSSKIILKVSEDLAVRMTELETELKDKYSILS